MRGVSNLVYLLTVLLLSSLVSALPAAQAVQAVAASLRGQHAVNGHLELRYVYYYHDNYSRYRIIGGVCAAAVVIIGITTTLLWWRRRERRKNDVMRPAIWLKDMPADPRRTVMSGAMINPHAVLTLSQFNYIPRTVSKGDSGSCNLCSKNIARNEEVVSLHPCNHKFHVECAFDWFTQKSTHCSECGQDMIKALGLPEPTFFANPETEAAGSVAYPMPNPNYHIANKNDGSYPAAPNQAHVSDKHSPFLQ